MSSIFRQSLSTSFLFQCALLVLIGITVFVITRQVLYTHLQLNPDLYMKEMPFYQVLLKHDPVLYDRIRNDVEQAMANRTSPMALKMKVRRYLDQILSSRIPRSSNVSIIAYMRVTLEEMKQLRLHGDGLCYQFLYPQANQMIDIAQYVPQQLIQEDIKALTEVIRSSYENPVALPNEREVRKNLDQVQHTITQNYGEEIALMQTPLAHNIDKDKICSITIALFEEILKLPPQQSGQALRYIALKNQQAKN